MFVVQLFTEFAYMARVTPRADVFSSALATKRPTCIVRLFSSRFEEIRATRINSFGLGLKKSPIIFSTGHSTNQLLMDQRMKSQPLSYRILKKG